MIRRLLAKVRFRPAPDYDGIPDFDSGYPNALTSKVDRSETSLHLPMFDVDNTMWSIIPSRSKGHSHIYVDFCITWEQYAAILVALRDAGLIDYHWACAVMQQKVATLRLPWLLDDSLALVREPVALLTDGKVQL